MSPCVLGLRPSVDFLDASGSEGNTAESAAQLEETPEHFAGGVAEAHRPAGTSGPATRPWHCLPCLGCAEPGVHLKHAVQQKQQKSGLSWTIKEHVGQAHLVDLELYFEPAAAEISEEG